MHKVSAPRASCIHISQPPHILQKPRQPQRGSLLAQRVRDSLVQERARLGEGLAAVPYLEPFPSSANFVLCRVGGSRDAKQLKDALAQRHGIMVRGFAYPLGILQ